ncbi:Uncharacterised protein [Lelliottia amnigena]|nr:Uncharacterised protein [Lelliottia amnigena]
MSTSDPHQVTENGSHLVAVFDVCFLSLGRGVRASGIRFDALLFCCSPLHNPIQHF